MYNEFYGFSEKPFKITPDPKFLYVTSSIRETLDSVMKDIKNRQGVISITGEAGTGKTTLIYYLLMILNHKVKTAFIFHPSVTFEDLLEIILRERCIKVTGKDKQTLLNQFIEYLLHIGSDETMAVIIDEAQHLSKETLEELGKLFECFEDMATMRLKIIFVGQPEFEDMLNLSGLKIISQKTDIRSKIKALTEEESRKYVEHRLKLVGCSTSEIFSPKAISVVTDYAQGSPRVINIVCDNALMSSFTESKKKIDEKIILKVIKNLEGPSHRAFMPLRNLSFVKRTNLIRHKRIPPPRIMSEYNSNPSIHISDFISQKQIAVMFMLLLGLVVIVFLMWTSP